MHTTSKLPGGYYISAGNLFREGIDCPLSNFCVIPTAAYRLSNNALPCFADISVLRSGGSIPLVQRMELTALTPKWWKNPPPGCTYYPGVRGTARHLQAIFQLMLEKLDPVEIFQPAELGWIRLPTGEDVYITGDGAIGADGFLPRDQVWISESLSKYHLEQTPEIPLSQALEHFWRLFGLRPGLTDILLVNALSAILLPCFKAAGVESRFPLILEGPTGAKKTTLACLTSSLYNRAQTMRGCVATLTSTKKALEVRGASLRHTVIVFDDLFPDGGGALERKSLELIRDIANQIPREACSGNSLAGVAMECGVVITAEAFPDCGLSTRTRCLRLPLSAEIPSSALAPLQSDPALLGNIFFEFISRLSGRFAEISRQVQDDFQSYRAQRAQIDAPQVKSERLAEIGFILHV